MSAWLHRFPTGSAPVARLVCFAHAGGTAMAYRLWPAGLPDGLEVLAVQLPGRAQRLREPPVARIPALVEALAEELAAWQDLPYALFGHSMGAVLALEVARALVADGRRAPAQLFLSARRPPHLPRLESDLHPLPDEAFLAELDARYGGVPAEILQHRDLLELLLPALRADITALETFTPPEGPPLACPITALGGDRDPFATFDQLRAWRGYTRGAFRVRQFPGGHFYLDAARDQLLAEIAGALSPLVGEPATGRVAV